MLHKYIHRRSASVAQQLERSLYDREGVGPKPPRGENVMTSGCDVCPKNVSCINPMTGHFT